MKQSEQLARWCKEVLLEGLWIANANYKDQLKDLTWKQAINQIGSLNSVALLTFHVNYYISGILPIFERSSLKISDQYSFDAPPITSQTQWERRVPHF